ncbi:MAG: hypothetical protein DRN29_08860 [Thermoplasmata archaeon]|nr:MAG: hypothetical protein DRN29_08860 [Thermoplasmata archaeon]
MLKSLKKQNKKELDKRLNLLEALWGLTEILDDSFQEIYDYVLEKLLDLTRSKYAFWGHINESKDTITIYSWSEEAMKNRQIGDKPITYSIADAGIWADSVRKKKTIIINEYEKYDKHGLPEGPVAIKRLLSVPIFSHNRITAIAVVANKLAKYTQEDAEYVKVFVTSAQTIIERKKTEEALKESEEKYRLMIESVENYAIFALDPEGHIVSWSPEAERIKGYREEEIIGKHFSCFYTEEERRNGKPEKELELAAAKGKIEDEGWRVRKDGSYFWANIIITALRDEDGKLVGFVKVVRDLTEKKRMEEMLEEERRLFIGGPVVVFKWIAGENSIPVLYVSSNVKDQFGYKPEDFISGKINYADIVHPDDIERINKEAKLYREKGTPYFEQDYRILTADGEYRWVHDFTVIERDLEGKIKHYHGYVMDITERKRMEKELKTAYEKVRKTLEQEREFKLRIAHYFFNPIAIAKGYLSLVLEEGYSEEKIKRAIDAINRIEKVVHNVTKRGKIVE